MNEEVEMPRRALITLLSVSLTLIILSSCSSSGQDRTQLPSIDAGEGKNLVRVNGGGFWVQTYLGQHSGANIAVFKMLVIYPGIDGFGNKHQLISGADDQRIRISLNGNGEMNDLITYDGKAATVLIANKKYNINLGDYIVINLTDFPTVKVLQKNTQKPDEETNSEKVLKSFQQIFSSEASVTGLTYR